MRDKTIKVAFDCNVIGSVLIGGISRQRFIEVLNAENNLQLYHCEQLLYEIRKLKDVPYFKKKNSDERIFTSFIQELNIRSLIVELESKNLISRDVKDNYLLDLSQDADLDYLITGDKDLLILESHYSTKIITLKSFVEFLQR
ncbi:MAG: putative toxin-antitoxin system toxin component, PIN family [Spirosomaceae bacterium]|nr:putative toxin-antitoxin system toxin component, PIN family [Spirosomataceae bacterium]